MNISTYEVVRLWGLQWTKFSFIALSSFPPPQLWILPAFGCRPQYDNGLEQETFGFSIWTTVLNFAIPLNLFYRMHSVASLFEVFRRVWRAEGMTHNDKKYALGHLSQLAANSASQRKSTVQEAVPVTLQQTWKPPRQTKCRWLCAGITDVDESLRDYPPQRVVSYNLMPIQDADEKSLCVSHFSWFLSELHCVEREHSDRDAHLALR